jgi:hypothetical protein
LQDRLMQWNTIKSGGIALAAGVLLGLVGMRLVDNRRAAAGRSAAGTE